MVSTRPKVITPNYITHLSSCEVFVFGSNLAGHHHGGAARMAHEQFGAEWGVGVGPTGQCYAIPTMLACRCKRLGRQCSKSSR